MKVCILDPGLGTHAGAPNTNLGDLIIQDAVNREVAALFPGAAVTRFSTHQPLGFGQLREISRCDQVLVGGTNLLSSHILKYRQWKISPLDARHLRKAILLGVGWWQYQDDADLITRLTLRAVLSKEDRHSVRVFDRQLERFRAPLENVDYRLGDFADKAACVLGANKVTTRDKIIESL